MHRQFNLHVVADGIQIKHAVMQWRFIAVEMFDKSLDAALILKNIFLVSALVAQADADAGIQKR